MACSASGNLSSWFITYLLSNWSTVQVLYKDFLLIVVHVRHGQWTGKEGKGYMGGVERQNRQRIICLEKGKTR